MGEVIWYSAANHDGTKGLKQHAFIHKKRKMKYTLEPYDGNISLCGKIMISDDGERSCAIIEIEGEILNEIKACKICLKKSNN